jgi:hypothetical protein
LIAKGAGVITGLHGALRADETQLDEVLTTCFGAALFGSAVRDDIFAVPEHGRCIIGVDHHDVVNVSFADPSEMDGFIAHMSAKGFELPTEAPDATFKPQPWMKQ